MVLRNALILGQVLLGNLCLLAACEDTMCRWVIGAMTSYLSATVYAVLTRRHPMRGD